MAVFKIVCGLGNPGPEYQGSPHNAGFEAVTKLREILKAPKFKKSGEALVSAAKIKGEQVLLVLPQTYMNRSGEALGKLAAKHGVSPGEIIVCYDDLDLPFGSVKLRLSGGAGGHHGMESIIEELCSDKFPRVRIGVRDEAVSKEETVDYLLRPLCEERYNELLEACAAAAAAMRDSLFIGWQKAMSLHNKRKPPATKEGEKNE